MSETSINSFSEGMVTDLDKSLKSVNSYSYASNLRYLANINENTGTLHSIESSKDVYSSFSLGSNEYIIGHKLIRDYLVLFTTEYSTTRTDYIRRFNVNDDTISNSFLVYTSTTDNIYGAVGSALPEYLTTAGIYEDEDNIKVYWSNLDSPLRSINITELYTGDPNRLNSIPLFVDVAPTLTITSGALNSGRVQYAYSLYKEKGQESVISSVTNLIDLFKDPVDASSTVLIKGDSEIVNTGKGVNVSISSLDSDDIDYFDKIRLYRIYYSEYGQLPTITIVNDYSIPTVGYITIIDTGGDGLGSYTAEEFSVISGTQYNIYAIEEKDNILVGGNVKEEVFDVSDYDARAYRFNSSGVANLYSSYDSYTTPEYTLSGATPSYSSVDSEANCINPHNDIEYDNVATTYDYIYQLDGTTRGGEGENISYTFSGSSFISIDQGTPRDDASTYSGINDYSQPDYTIRYTGYQRGEIYRFGILFKNKYGISSPVKWIGDIRMPMDNAFTSNITNELSTVIFANPVLITFTVSTLPTDAVSYEIVRVPREKKDKSIVTTGYLSISYIDLNDDQTTCRYPWPIVSGTNLPWTAYGSDDLDVLTFVSPEECYQGYSDINEGDYVHVIGSLNNYVVYNSYPTDSTVDLQKQAIKFRDISVFYDLSSYKTKEFRYSIDQVEFVGSGINPIQKYSFSKANNGIYTAYIRYESSGIADILEQQHGRGSVLEIDSSFDNSYFTTVALADVYDIPYAYITRDNPGRYGGYTSSAKELNNYIKANGDTFINYFDYLHTIYNQEDSSGSAISEINRASVSVIFPCESTVNSSLRYDKHFAKNSTNVNVALMKEYAGTYIHDASSENTYIQETDLYLSNSIYSQEDNINIDFSAETVDLEKNLDTRVVHSDTKVYDETIDSWSKFRPLNFLDVESRYGAIKSLNKFNNNLYYIQDKAIGILSINQRSLFSDSNPGALSLGTGGVLDRFDYINEFYGVQHKKSITTSKGGLYFFDKNNKSIVSFNGNQLELLTESKGLKTYVNNLTLQDIPLVEDSSRNSEIYFQLGSNLLVYNNFTGTFIGEYTVETDYIADIDKFTTYSSKEVSDNIYGLYLGTTYGNLYGTVYNNSTLKVTNNDSFYNTKTYDNVIFFSTSKLNGVERNTDSFDSVSFYNDFQYTGETALTLGGNLTTRERGYALDIPRNIVNANGTTNIDIFDVTNQDSTRKFKERMRDKYITAEFTYENSATKGQLSVPYISFLYRQSKR